MRYAGIIAMFLLLSFQESVFSQGVNKCKGPGGKITYSSEPCEKEGLKDAGPIRDRVTVIHEGAKPAAKADTRPAPDSRPASKDGKAAKKDDAELRSPAASVKPINPLIEQLAK